MMSLLKRCIFPLFLLCALLAACSDPQDVKIPTDVLSKEKMAEVMVDVHLLEATVNLTVSATDKAAFNEKGDMIDVYKKHGITRKQYDDSYIFYTRHPEILGEIYQQVLNELSKMQAQVTNGK